MLHEETPCETTSARVRPAFLADTTCTDLLFRFFSTFALGVCAASLSSLVKGADICELVDSPLCDSSSEDDEDDELMGDVSRGHVHLAHQFFYEGPQFLQYRGDIAHFYPVYF